VRLAARGIPLRADPKRSIFRIYRDTRFSKDKSPYKTHIAANFPWIDAERGEDREGGHAGGGYVNIEPGNHYVGGGLYMHDQLKRNPPGWPADHPMADLFRYRDIVFGRRMADAEVENPSLPDTLADAYEAGLPVLRFLATLRD
jgi:uncharacterized protein (DUF2461 family)